MENTTGNNSASRVFKFISEKGHVKGWVIMFIWTFLIMLFLFLGLIYPTIAKGWETMGSYILICYLSVLGMFFGTKKASDAYKYSIDKHTENNSEELLHSFAKKFESMVDIKVAANIANATVPEEVHNQKCNKDECECECECDKKN